MNKAIEEYKHLNLNFSSYTIQRQLNVEAFAMELDRQEFTVRRIVPTTGRIMTARPDTSTEAIWVHVSQMSLDYKIIEVRLYDNSMSFVLG